MWQKASDLVESLSPNDGSEQNRDLESVYHLKETVVPANEDAKRDEEPKSTKDQVKQEPNAEASREPTQEVPRREPKPEKGPRARPERPTEANGNGTNGKNSCAFIIKELGRNLGGCRHALPWQSFLWLFFQAMLTKVSVVFVTLLKHSYQPLTQLST